NLLAGVGRAQLQVLEDRVAARRTIFERYKEALGGRPGLTFMPELEGTRSNRWLTALTVDEAAASVSPLAIVAALAEDDIEARPVWKPLHLQPLFAGAAYYTHDGRESVSDRLFRTGLCLPSGSAMTPEQQWRVIERLEQCMQAGSVAAGA